MADELIPWINSAGEGGVRNSMQEFPGNGTNGPFEFNFAGAGNGYIDQSHVKAYRYDPVSAQTYTQTLTFVGPNQVTTSDVIPTGQFVVIYRDTPKAQPLVNYSEGAVMDETNLDKSNEQAVYIAAEMLDRFDAINATSSDAINRSVQALDTANTALANSQSAQSDATSAVSAANSATAAASAATTTANTALSTANDAHTIATGIDAKATQAQSDAAEAVTTANGIDAKAQTALDNSNEAVSQVGTANANATSALSLASSVSSKADNAVATANAAATQAASAYQKTGGDINGPVVQTALDSGGMQYRSIYGNYGAGFRNDGSSFYLMATNAGDTRGSYSAIRPFLYNLASGAVNIDLSGAGTAFGGAVSVGGTLTAAAASVSGNLVVSGQASFASNVGVNGLLNVVGSSGNPGRIRIASTDGSDAYITGRASGGGLYFYASTGTAITAILDNAGDFSVTGNLVANGSVYTNGGASYLLTNGDTYGSIWSTRGGSAAAGFDYLNASKTAKGAQVTHSGSYNNFGAVSNMSGTLPAPWVVTGVFSSGLGNATANAINVIGAVLVTS